jgi:hypothetical protein
MLLAHINCASAVKWWARGCFNSSSMALLLALPLLVQ